MDKTYNGWKNYETWNVALWINNDYGLYTAAKEFANGNKGKVRAMYKTFVESYGLDKTPDNVKYLSTKLDYRRLNEMMLDL